MLKLNVTKALPATGREHPTLHAQRAGGRTQGWWSCCGHVSSQHWAWGQRAWAEGKLRDASLCSVYFHSIPVPMAVTWVRHGVNRVVELGSKWNR